MDDVYKDNSSESITFEQDFEEGSQDVLLDIQANGGCMAVEIGVTKLRLFKESCIVSRPSLCYLPFSVARRNYTCISDEQLNVLHEILNPAEINRLNRLSKKANRFYKNQFKSIDMRKSYPSILKLMWSVALPCHGNILSKFTFYHR